LKPSSRSTPLATSLQPPGREGALTLPLALLLSVLASACLGLLGLQKLWRSQTENQLELDHCVGALAIRMATIQQRVHDLNQAMVAARLAKAGALAAGQAPLAAGATATLRWAVILQEKERLSWLGLQASGRARASCPWSGVGPFSWYRPPPDPLGDRPLQWPSSRPMAYVLSIQRRGKNSHASLHFKPQRWIPSYSLLPEELRVRAGAF
jgi:hypothetical protein